MLLGFSLRETLNKRVFDPEVEDAYRQDAAYVLSLAPLLFALGLAVEAYSHVGRDTAPIVWLHALMSLACGVLFVVLKLRLMRPQLPELWLVVLWAMILVSVFSHVIWFGHAGIDASTLILTLVVVGTGALILPTLAGSITLGFGSCGLFVLFYLDSVQDPMQNISVPLVITFAAILVYTARRWNIRQNVYRRKMDAKLHEQAAKLQSANAVARVSTRLSASFAHHFNNQLQSVLLGADGVMMLLPDNHPSREMLAEIQRSALRGAEMTSSLLRYASDVPIRRERFSALSFIEEFRFAEQGKDGVALHVEVGDVELVADRNLLASALFEVLRNANKAVNAKDGKIDLSLEACQAGVTIYVTDNGEGIPDNLKAAATEPFVTSDPASRFGLGLALASSIVEKHGGTLEIVYSNSTGTKIRIHLPSEPGFSHPGATGS
ncbi:MAG: ATP-binding protein [bacterium]